MRRYVTMEGLPDDINVCLVLGARLGENNSLTPILKLRLSLVERLSKLRPDIKFLISGCHEDTHTLYKYLVEVSQIPEDRFLIDFLGKNTFCSVQNIVKIYGIKRFAVLTSTFHILRTMIYALGLGNDAYAIDIRSFEKVKKNPYRTREFIATIKAILFIIAYHLGIIRIKQHINENKKLKKELALKENVCSVDKQDIDLVEKILAQAFVDKPSGNIVTYFADKLCSIESKDITVTNFEPEQLIIKPRIMDCTSYVEYVLAYSMCYEERLEKYEDFCDKVMKIRYRNGIVDGYQSRNHYFSWVIENGIENGFFREIVHDGFPFTERLSLTFNFMSTFKTEYPILCKHPDVLNEIKKRESEFSGRTWPYIGRDTFANKEYDWKSLIKDGDILSIAINQHSWARGLDIKHNTIAKWIGDELLFYHCNDENGVELSKNNIFEFLQPKFCMNGFRIIRLVPVEERLN